jgi:DNA-binding IclR family transcriptional regulator
MQQLCFRQKILDYFQKPMDRPVLVGQVCLALNLRLAEVEGVLEGLVADGLLRHATPAEMKRYDIHQGYVLV